MHTHQPLHRHPELLLARVVESASKDPVSGFFPSERRGSLAVRLLARFRSIGGSLVGAKIAEAFYYSLSVAARRPMKSSTAVRCPLTTTALSKAPVADFLPMVNPKRWSGP